MTSTTATTALSAEHAAYLENAGITSQTLAAFGVRTITDLGEAGQEYAPYAAAPAIVFPWTGPRGDTVEILRPDNPVTADGGSPVKYVSPRGAKPILWQAREHSGDTILIVEGCKQTLAAVSAGVELSIYGMNGCWGWRERVDDATSVPIADLAVVEGRHVVVALDADAASNRMVYDAGAGLADACRAEGALGVRFVRLPAGHRTGLDDLLASRAPERRQAYLERLVAEAKPKPADVKPRQRPEANPSRYFATDASGRQTFLAATLANDVQGVGPVAVGIDGRFWAYDDGVWVPAPNIVLERAAWLMGELFRNSHARNSETIVAATTAHRISSEPVPEYLNFRNGLLDWRTGARYQHTPDVPSTVQLGVDWNPAAACPAFERFLTEVVPADVVETVWELIGYLMFSGNPLHKAIMLVGKGRNGKGTLLRVVKALLSERNVTAVSLHDLVNTRFTTAMLFGKIANIAGDVDGTYLESTAVLKAITGEDMISAEHKGRDRFDFTPWAVPVFSANKVPASADTTIGYLSRWLVVPFPNDFRGREDAGLTARLTAPAELEGIAARAVEALRRLMDRQRFCDTESMREAKRDFERRVNQVQAWLDDCCHIDDAHPFVPRKTLYAAYRAWAEASGYKPVRATEFYDRLESVPGVRVSRVYSGERGFTGISLQPPAMDQPELSVGKTPVDQRKREHTDSTDSSAIPPRVRARAQAGGGVAGSVSPVSEAPKPDADQAERADGDLSVVALPAAVNRTGRVIPLSLVEARQAVQLTVELSGALTVDVETSGYPIGHRAHALRTVQLGDENVAVVLDAADPEQAGLVRELLAAAPRLHAHSATADLVPLVHAGLCDDSAWERMHDTVIPAKLADPASTGSDPGLKQLAKVMLGDQAVSPGADETRAALFRRNRWVTNTKVTTAAGRSGWAQVDPADPTMVVYAASDVLDTGAIAARMPQLPEQLIERERAVQRITARIAHHGLRVEADTVRALADRHTTAARAAAERIRALGVDNPNSNVQIAEWLVHEGAALPATSTGRPSVAGDVLEKMRGLPGRVGEMVDAVLEHRGHDKVLGTFIEPYRQAIEHGDGRVRPTIYTLQADTGRMSCVRPNLQQVPRSGGIRACLTADPGQLLVSADFSGVELRVAAALSGDTSLCRMLADGVDLHWEIARQVFGPDATKVNRYVAKRIVFGRLYGGGVATLAKQAGVSEDIAARAVRSLDQMTPELTSWTNRWRDAVRNGHTQFQAYSGRVIHLQPEHPHKTTNYLIQGTARELFVDALLRWRRTRWGDCVVLPVHDEIVAAVPAEDAQVATAALAECMTTQLHGVEIVAEASQPSFAWADAA